MNIENYIKKYFENRPIESQSSKLGTWARWYAGYDKDFHDYSVYNGEKKVKLTKKSLNIAKKSCEDWANLLLNEKFEIVVKDKDKLYDVLNNNNFWVYANNLVEQSFALSMGAFVESLEDVIYNEETGELVKSKDSKVKIDYVDATKIYPITFKNRRLIECAFVSENTNQIDISIHKLNEDNEYDIINLFIEVDSNGNALNETEMVFHSRSTKPLFQIIKPNICNNKDLGSPLGISVFANAIDTLKAIDNAYDSFDTEIQYGRRRIMVDDRLMNVSLDGVMSPAFDSNDVVFYRLPPNPDGKNLIEDISGQLRTNDISLALQEQLNTYASLVGFGKNYYTFGASGGGRPIQTATGIIAQNSDLFRNLKKHELLLEKAIMDMVEAVAFLSNTYTTEKIDTTDLKVVFDDSIIEDTEAQKTSDRTDVANGIMSKVEYRGKWYGEQEEIATEKLDAFGLNDLDTRINALLPALESGVITPEEFAKKVYKDKDDAEITQIATYIQENLSKASQPINLDYLTGTGNE